LQGEVAATVRYVVLTRLIALANDESATPQVRNIATLQVENMKNYGATGFAADLIATFNRNPKEVILPKLAEPPPGQPIGEDYDGWPW
jgi:hypothetical protein